MKQPTSSNIDIAIGDLYSATYPVGTNHAEEYVVLDGRCDTCWGEMQENVRGSNSILAVDDDELIRELLKVALTRAGYEVTLASDGHDALQRLGEATPDLIISDVMMPGLDGFALIERLRSDTSTRAVPLIFLTSRGATTDVVRGLGLGADDYLVKPFDVGELLARVHSKISRPPVPSELLPVDRQTGLLSEALLLDELRREIARCARGGAPGVLACLYLDEIPRVRERLGARAEAIIARQITQCIEEDAQPLEVVGRDGEGRFLLLLANSSPESARARLLALSDRIAGRTFAVGEERLRFTPIIGFEPFSAADSAASVHQHALVAMLSAASHLDLQPARYRPAMDAEVTEARTVTTRNFLSPAVLRERLRVPFQIAVTVFVGMVLPFAIYAALGALGFDITNIVYFVVVVSLLLTAYFIWHEGLLALKPAHPPEEPGVPYPPASAVIAAYLPNEAATVVETIEAFLRIEYPAPLQIILAYNTPRPMPIERVLREIAERDSRFVPLKVEFSTSKAQNVNAALAMVIGEFVGVFDADHKPEPESFTRVWRWLSNGWDVVQGHCLVRNGDASWVARLVAVEFESIYAVSHPGRARLHHFGVFGGSNGYWKLDLLRRIRMHGFMLTEDIDSSLRAVEAGYKIASDPFLISRELAPATLKPLWNQRMRWAQGWFQVSLKHARHGLRSSHLSVRQKFGIFHLMIWREIYPWLSWQMFPIIVYWAWTRGGVQRLDWVVPIFILTSIFTLSTGPGQVIFAYLLGHPDIRHRRRWFVFYLAVTSVFYTEYKNLIARVAQIKELMRERQWKVTPRSASTAGSEGHPEVESESLVTLPFAPDTSASPEPSVGAAPAPLDFPPHVQVHTGREAQSMSRAMSSAGDGVAPAQPIHEATRNSENLDDEPGQRLNQERDVQKVGADTSRHVQHPSRDSYGAQDRFPLLGDIIGNSIPSREASEIAALVQALVDRPDDIALAARLSRHAPALREVVNAYIQTVRAAESRSYRPENNRGS